MTTDRDQLRDNDAVWARFYRDGKNLGEIAEEFGGGVYSYTPWLTAPLAKTAVQDLTTPDQAVMAERDSYKAALEEIAEFGHSHSGYGFSCAKAARTILSKIGEQK